MGEKRNLAIHQAAGHYVVTWDDDDYYDQSRISKQVLHLQESGRPSCALDQITLFDGMTGKAYLSAIRPWEQTLMYERSLFQERSFRYANLERGEDSVLVYKLLSREMLSRLNDPSLYVYHYHGSNTWDRSHWEENLLRHATLLPEQEIIRVAGYFDS